VVNNMRKKLLFVIMLFLTIFYIDTTVYAANKNDNCTSIERNELINQASTVTASYEFIYNEINEVIGFKYLVYNVPSNMKAQYYIMDPDSEYVLYNYVNIPIDPETGYGEVEDYNINDAYNVFIRVYRPGNTCQGVLKSIKIKKLKYNEYSEYDQCKYDGMEDFSYCKQWIDSDFALSEQQIIDKMNEQLEKNKVRTTGVCISCEENEQNNEIYETIVKIRKYAIIGLSIGIAVDLIMIYVFIKRVGESRL